MTREEFNQKLTEILASPGDVASISANLDTVREEHAAVLAAAAAAQNEAEALKKVNQDLIKQNMALFLKVGTDPGDAGSAEQEQDSPPRFEDLFDPKTGKLKEV